MTTRYSISQKALVLLLIILPIGLKAQQKEVSIRAFPSSWYNSYFEPAMDGYGLAVTWHPVLNKVSRFNISAEFDVLRARNEFLIGLGYNHPVIQRKKFRISLEANLLNGIDLYKPAPLYVGGLEADGRFDYYLNNGLALFISVGARQTFCPGYRSIGVWKYNSWPVTVGIRF